MLPTHRILSLSLVALLVTACNGAGESGFSSGPGNIADTKPTGGGGADTGPGGFSGAAGGPGGTKNTVIPTTSVPGTVCVTAGASQTVSVTFTSSDGRPIRGLGITSTTLPAHWSGTDNYSCTLVGAGSSCVLNLTYSPTVVESGSLTVTYVYINNANQPITPGGTVTIAYDATAAPNNNVVATSAPTGQIISSLGSSAQAVAVNFTTDDGNAGTNLALTTDLGSLPAGWSGKSPGFSCAIVSSGNGCQLVLSYLPKSAATGTLSLDYSYSDSMGTARTGTLNVPYSTTTNGTIVATASPMGQVNAVAKTGNQAVNVAFTTDDGRVARNLQVLSDLTALPAGWSSSASKFTCDSVSSRNGCQLTLNYAPGAIASGTLSLNYGYLDAGGTYNVGSFNIPYAATTNDNVVGTPAPSGEIDAIVGSTSPTVVVTFATDDGRPATALEVTSTLTALPAGWSSTDNSFTCSGVNGGTTCQLPLTYTPTGADSGALALAYQYVNDAGQTKTGTVNIPYRATTNNSVDATSNPTTVTALTGTTTPVSITFVTDDGNPARDLTVTSGLTPLPAGWSGPATPLSCPSVGTGTGCLLSLSYAPTAAANGTLTLSYSYTNNSGMTKAGAIAIGYTATIPPPPGP
jgi:hypothetical protein